MAAVAPAPAVVPPAPAILDPLTHLAPFGFLPQNVQDTIINMLYNWVFTRPDHPEGRVLRQGTWTSIPLRGPNNNAPLADGGAGVVHLWLCRDAQDRIVDRIIIKEVVPGSQYFNMQSRWHNGHVGGEPREFEITTRVYDELLAMGPGDKRHITACLGYGDVRHGVWNASLPGYKLYYEYAPHGDLFDLIEEQGARKVRSTRVGRDGIRRRRTIRNGPFPEGFLWMMFEALAKTAVAMERANVVHGDLGTPNILFANPDPQRFRIWPTPQVADFGSARYLNPNTIMRVDAAQEGCALHWAAPELVRDGNALNPATGLPPWETFQRVSTRTNVWQIGMDMACAMRLATALPENVWRGIPPTEWEEPNQAEQLRFGIPAQREVRRGRLQVAGAEYSGRLRRLVRRCLKYNPAERPRPRDLLRQIQRDMRTKLSGMRDYTTPTGRIPWNHAQRIAKPLKDMYPITG